MAEAAAKETAGWEQRVVVQVEAAGTVVAGRVGAVMEEEVLAAAAREGGAAAAARVAVWWVVAEACEVHSREVMVTEAEPMGWEGAAQVKAPMVSALQEAAVWVEVVKAAVGTVVEVMAEAAWAEGCWVAMVRGKASPAGWTAEEVGTEVHLQAATALVGEQWDLAAEASGEGVQALARPVTARAEVAHRVAVAQEVVATGVVVKAVAAQVEER